MTAAKGSAARERFKIRDATSYDPVAADFDHLSRRYTAPLAEHLVDLAELSDGERVLDVATGTGIVAATAVRRAPRCRVVGLDLSMGMLGRARGAAREDPPGNDPGWLRSDGERLAVRDGSIDAALSLFGLLHFPHPETALRELFRVLRPGGRLVVAFGSGPSRWTPAGWVDGARRLWALVERRRGKLLEAPELLHRLVETHLPGTAEPEETHLARRGGRRAFAARQIRAAGFRRLRLDWRGHQPRVETEEEFWQIQATFSSRARKRLASASPAAAGQVRHEFSKACERVLRGGGHLAYPYAAAFVSAIRPPGV